MRKTIAVILSLLLVLALFAGCSAKPGEEGNKATDAPADVTEAPKATDAPKPTEAPKPTDVPATEAPTATPEPTEKPFDDPYNVEIFDWDDCDVNNFSFDTIKVNGTNKADGNVAAYRLDIDDTVDGTDGSVKTVSMRGWAGFVEENIVRAGYQIDNGPVVLSDKYFENTEPAVKGAGGEYAIRICVNIPVDNLAGAQHELKIVVETETGTLVYLNPGLNPWVLFYDGPAAEEAALDGAIGFGEYTAKYVLDNTNAQTWTNSTIGDSSLEYYLNLKEDGLYVGVVGKGVKAGDMIQLNFNPGARLDKVPGLFLSFVLGDSLKVLQHNHKTALKDDPAAGGVDITSLVESTVVATEDGFVFEVKLPADLFKVTDVEKADQFALGKERLYFGMFAVLNGKDGYTNQSTAPGASWNAGDLGIHEYFI